jgi:hypothetical protein
MRALLHRPRIAFAQDGLGVYVQHHATGRVSLRRGKEFVDEQLAVLERLWHRAQAIGLKETRLSFASAFYRTACEAYLIRIPAAGDKALGLAREFGLRGHIGSRRHRVLSSVLGLNGKLKLWQFLKGA